MSIQSFFITIIVLSLLIGVIVIVGTIIRNGEIKKNKKSTALTVENLSDFAFIQTFEEFRVYKSMVRNNYCITFTLKVGEISVDRRLEAHTFEEVLFKLKNWYKKNKSNLEFIDQTLEKVD